VESAGLSLPAVRPAAERAARAFVVVAPAVGVVALAAVLRFAHLERVPDNPFYDAAVRSMSLSWHNFFFGAFDPSARLAIDKPPLDLWLQVASVKLLGFNSFALKLPEALGGTIAVALLYDLVRRPFGRAAGFLAALALAVLPAAVLTGRSDTMDSVMSALMVAALWLALVGAQRHRAGLLYLAAVAVGLAFNVKLFEALLVVPPLVLLWAIAGPRGLARRVEQLLVAGVVMIVVSLSWATAVSLVPSQHRPYPIGSTDGTVWNAMFVWDGLDRFNGKAGSAATAVHHHHRLSRHRKELLARDDASARLAAGYRLGARAGADPRRARACDRARGLAGSAACAALGAGGRGSQPLGGGGFTRHLARARRRAVQRGADAAHAVPGGVLARDRGRARHRAGHGGAPPGRFTRGGRLGAPAV
jgi:hypothetical protein